MTENKLALLILFLEEWLDEACWESCEEAKAHVRETAEIAKDVLFMMAPLSYPRSFSRPRAENTQ